MDGLYVFNNPWAIQSMEKHTSYCAMMRLGMPIPETWIVPPKDYEFKPDLAITLSRYARLFDLDEVGAAVGYPLFAKPFDGGGWAGVSRVDDGAALHRAYDESGTYLLHLQRAVEPHDLFVRCIGFGPQTRLVRYDPSAPLHDRYTMDDGGVPDDQRQTLIDTTLTINSFFGWEFNSCEALRQGDTWHPIDFANACPDSQVTSLHYHFPWLVAANLRWSIFCAATKRPMPVNLDWAPYFEIADTDAPVRREARRPTRRSPGSASRPPSSSRSARPTSPTSTRSCGSSSPPRSAYDAVRQKVATLFPAHEIDQFTDLFWGRIQQWRARLGSRAAEVDVPKTTARLVLRAGRARRRPGALGHRSARRCSCSRPPAATPRRSSASTSSTRARELIDAGRVKLYSVDSVNGRVLLAERGRQRPPGVDPAAVLRVPPPRGRAGDPQRLRSPTTSRCIAAGSSIGAFNALGVRVPVPRRVQGRRSA